MPPTSSRAAVAAFGRQTAEGTALASPKFEIPMGPGGIQPRRDVEELPWTNDSQDTTGHYVRQVAGDFSMDLPVLPVSSVGLILSALGTRTTTGVAAPYTHVDSFSSVLPWYTWFFRIGDQYLTLADAKTGAMELTASAGEPLGLSISGVGKATTRAATKWAAATTTEPVTPFFTMINSVLKLESSTSPAATTVRNIPGMSLSVNRNLEEIQTDGVSTQFVVEGKRESSLTCSDVVLEDWNFVNSVFFGSPTGTTLSSQPLYGSAEFTFRGSDEATAATRSLKITVPRIHWNIAAHPGADPGGAPVRYDLEGAIAKPTTGSTLDITVINGDAGTNY